MKVNAQGAKPQRRKPFSNGMIEKDFRALIGQLKNVSPGKPLKGFTVKYEEGSM